LSDLCAPLFGRCVMAMDRHRVSERGTLRVSSLGHLALRIQLSEGLAAFHAARVFAENVARVTDTLVPFEPAKVSTWAPSCCASALTMLVPSPVFA
jgi:hypothetical protein